MKRARRSRSASTAVCPAVGEVLALPELVELILHYETDGGELRYMTRSLRLVNRLFCASVSRVITRCNILGPDSTFVALMPALTELNLYDSRISTATLRQLPGLTRLRLNCPYDSDLDFNRSLMESLPNLRFLSAQGFQVKIRHRGLSALTQLDTLSLQNCWIHPQTVAAAPLLTRLELLDNTCFGDADLAFFPRLKALKLEGGRNMKLTGETLHLLPSLRELSLRATHRVKIDSLQRLTCLETLTLHDCLWLDQTSLTSLTNLRRLRILETMPANCGPHKILCGVQL